MDWMYRLQERLAITKTEGIAMLTVTGLFLSGLLIQHVWELHATVPEDYYVTADSVFAAKTQRLSDTLPGHLQRLSMDTTDTTEEAVDRPTEQVRINLNAATARQLQQLSGIGPVLAERITVYREEYGAFRQLEDLTNVSGIGSKTLEDIRTLLYVEPDPSDE
jgi:competence protein ComEA